MMGSQNTNALKADGTSEEQKDVLKSAPLTVLAQYIKDFSFENPQPLQNLKQTSQTPEMSLNLDIQANQGEEGTFEVILHLKAEAKNTSYTLFIAELEYGGIFKLGNVPQEAVHPILMIECPRLLFPYARLIIANITREAGFPTLALTPIDFVELYRKQYVEPQQQKAATQAKTGS